jgi:hypothetical protein
VLTVLTQKCVLCGEHSVQRKARFIAPLSLLAVPRSSRHHPAHAECAGRRAGSRAWRRVMLELLKGRAKAQHDHSFLLGAGSAHRPETN